MADAKNKREGTRSGPSFLFALAALGIMGLLVVGAVTIPGVITRATLAADPVNVFIKRHHDQCRATPCSTPSMIPELFADGESRDDVEARLVRAGYRSTEPDRYIHAHADGALPACEIDYYVTVEFDTDSRLTKASGQTTASCL